MESSKSHSTFSASFFKNSHYDKYVNTNLLKVYNIGNHRIEIDERFEMKQSSKKNKE